MTWLLCTKQFDKVKIHDNLTCVTCFLHYFNSFWLLFRCRAGEGWGVVCHVTECIQDVKMGFLLQNLHCCDYLQGWKYAPLMLVILPQ